MLAFKFSMHMSKGLNDFETGKNRSAWTVQALSGYPEISKLHFCNNILVKNTDDVNVANSEQCWDIPIVAIFEVK